MSNLAVGHTTPEGGAEAFRFWGALGAGPGYGSAWASLSVFLEGPQAVVWPIRLWKQDWNLPPLSPHYFSPVPGPFEQTHDASKEALCKWPCKRCHSATTSNGDYQKAHLGPRCSLATWALTRLPLCLSMLTWIIYDLYDVSCCHPTNSANVDESNHGGHIN